MGTYFDYITIVLSYIGNNLIGIINILIVFLLFREAKKMRDISTQPELIFYLKLVNQYTVVGRLENVGNGIAYNVSVEANNDFRLFHGNNFNTAFEKIKSLAPKQYFDIQMDYINVGNEMMYIEKETEIEVQWTKSKKIKNSLFMYKMILDRAYFKNIPRISSLSDVVDAINHLESKFRNRFH